MKTFILIIKRVFAITLTLAIISCSKGGSDAPPAPIVINPPTVVTIEVKDVTYFEAKVKSQITNDGGKTVSEKGICWSLNANPTKADNYIIYSGIESPFICTIKNLIINTTYHVRSYAINEKGTSYGTDLTFKTLDENTLPAAIEPLLNTKWTVFTWPYNAFYPAFSGKNSVNNRLAAPCGPTTLSRVLAYWGGKIKCTGLVDAMDSPNTTRFKVLLDTIIINYNNLETSLSSNSSYSEYKDVAKLFLTAGAVGLTSYMDVATPGDAYINGLKKYFNVSDNVRFAKRWEYTREAWIALLKKELAYGRPLMIAARKSTSPKPGDPGNVEGHWFNIEGYNSENKFFIDYNYQGTGFRGYFDIDDFGEYNSYGLVVINFQPK